jgi:hypothetical protein
VASNDKDLDYKLKVSAILGKMGYTVFQEVDLSTFSYQPKYQRKQVSDFDVLGLLIEPDFGVTTAVAECKTIEEKAMEVLLKLKGLKSFFAADKAYLVQKRVDVNAREVARDMGIWCFDDGNLAVLQKGLDVKDDVEVAIERDVYLRKEAISKALKNEHQKAHEYLRYDFWTLPAFRNIINLLRHAALLAEKLDAKKNNDIVLAHLMATNLSVAISRLTLDVMRFDNSDIETGVKNRIHGGTRERRDREALFDTVAKIVGDERLSIEPPFLPALTELVARFINASAAACQVVKCLDHMTRERVLPDFSRVAGTAEKVFGDRMVKLARDVLYFISREGHISIDLFKDSLTASLTAD